MGDIKAIGSITGYISPMATLRGSLSGVSTTPHSYKTMSPLRCIEYLRVLLLRGGLFFVFTSYFIFSISSFSHSNSLCVYTFSVISEIL